MFMKRLKTIARFVLNCAYKQRTLNTSCQNISLDKKEWFEIRFLENGKIVERANFVDEHNVSGIKNDIDRFFLEHDFLTKGNKELSCYLLEDVEVFPGLFDVAYDRESSTAYLSSSSRHYDSYNSQEFMGLIEFNEDRTKLCFCENINVTELDEIDCGIDLTGGINNYWHVLVDLVPKVIIADQLGIPNNIPLLVPGNLHDNFVDLIRVVSGKRDVIVVPGFEQSKKEFRSVRVKKLYCLSKYYSYLFHPINDIYDFPMKSEISPQPLKMAVDKILDYYKIEPKLDESLKLVWKRNSNYRISDSQDQLVKVAVQNGYTVFEPEKMSLEEQIRLISQASSFIGFFGAAVSNTLFMHPDAKKIIFGNASFYTIASFWDCFLSNATILKNDVAKVEGSDGIHDTPILSEENWDILKEIL